MSGRRPARTFRPRPESSRRIASGRSSRRIGARRNRRVTRTAIQPPLKHSDPLILTSDTLDDRLDLGIHPQKHLNNRLTTRVIDRLSLNPLHTTRFDAPAMPPTN
jgi:hypothetical protein